MNSKYKSIEKKETIEKIITYIKKKVSDSEIKLITAFVRQFYSNVPTDDLLAKSIKDHAGIVLSMWELIYRRKPKESKVHVFNPDYKKNDWSSTHTIVEVVHEDIPFLVDSLRMEFNRLGYTIHLIIYCGGMKVYRDDKGHLTKIFPFDSDVKDALVEAPIYLEIDKQTDKQVLKKIHDSLQRILGDVRVAVEDWGKMRERVYEAIADIERENPPLDPEDKEESITFLHWLAHDHFTFLGSRKYEIIEIDGKMALQLIPGSGLGVLRDESKSKVIRFFDELPPMARKRALSKQIIIISETNTRATVHRPKYTDYIGVKHFDSEGRLVGEWRFIGLYTSDAYNSKLSDIPLIRRKVETIIKKSGLSHNAHACKTLLNILETFPRDDIFQCDTNLLCDVAMGILHLQDRKIVKLFILPDAYGRYYSCLVYVPRDNLSTDLIRKMQDILVSHLDGIEVSFDTYFPESVLARVHYVIRVDRRKKTKPAIDIKEIEQKLKQIARSWRDDLYEHILKYFGEEEGNRLINRYLHAFPAGYRETYDPSVAIYDIKHLEKLSADHELELSTYRVPDAEPNNIRFKLYRLHNAIPLSDVLPILENLGLRVIGEEPFEITYPDGVKAWINDFNVYYDSNEVLDVNEIKDLLQEAFSKIWFKEAENDGFNRLVLASKINWREVTVLRSYTKFLRQIGFTFSQPYIEETFYRNFKVAKLIVDFFNVRFDPNLTVERETIKHLEDTLAKEFDLVLNLDEDRILRTFAEVIKATLRTNYFQKDDLDNYKPYVSFKFNSSEITDMPLPIPKYETFVYSVAFEGVHLRAAKVARGGIRWSNRKEDFRTEVLGLMKAQQVKNAVIVPEGAKGGFVVRNLPTDANRERILQEGISCYKYFIRGLLDITDNLINDKVVRPPDTVCYDENDSYLVVAADKGTATFSDIANDISLHYDFWLRDAFASGGSAGYDHKKMGITARGAWESVKRHFKELNLNPDVDDFTVIGIGDMSGDVFGNGMLLSDHIKLIAAFNHNHIFIDPNPDRKTSYFERMRLFKLPGSSWEDYDPNLISKGGGVYSRSAKSIKLSNEARAVLGIHKESIVPNELIRSILKAPVDLLWNGGIGTYVKALAEANNEIGDRTNDAVRVNGHELQARVVAEGGNLGFTQLGRIEYELAGGKINTDFIDNSAGVDCSDHEVNIKILLNDLITKGEMTLKKRNTLLIQMTDEVAQLVLYDNYRQALTISFAIKKSMEYFELYRLFIDEQEMKGNLNRVLEFLPDDKTLHERRANLQGFTRPEIAILMAYSKIILKKDILNSDLPEDPALSKYIQMAFPKSLVKRFYEPMQHHHLRREIIATQLSNEMVTDMGITFVFQMQDENSATSAEVVRAYSAVREIFNLNLLFDEVERLDPHIPFDTFVEMSLDIMRLARRATRWFLLNRRSYYDIEQMVTRFGPPMTKLVKVLPDLLTGKEKKNVHEKINRLISMGVPAEVAKQIAMTHPMYSTLNIIEASLNKDANVTEVAKLYFLLMDKLELIWFREKINDYPVDNHWAVLARASYKGDLDNLQRALVVNVLEHESKAKKIEERISDWLGKNHTRVALWKSILGELRSSSTNEFSMLTVAMRELSELAQTTQQK